MDHDPLHFLEAFIGREWIEAEYAKTNSRSPLKAAGNRFAKYHPWVHFLYEVEYLLRRAEIENREEVTMGRYHYILSNASMLLEENIDSIPDKADAMKRLRHPDQFYDFIWELEVKTMLTHRGADVTMVKPTSGNTYDGLVCIEGTYIPYECKNKTTDDSKYVSNTTFCQVFANRIESIPTIQKRIVEISFDQSYLNDINTIVAGLRNLQPGQTTLSLLSRYKIRMLDNLPFDTSLPLFLSRPDIEFAFAIKECPRKELYCQSQPNAKDKVKVIVKMPARENKLKHLETVLKKANSQLKAGGIVFVQLPFHLFQQGKQKISHLLSKYFSNISAVKIVSYDIQDTHNGVKVGRKEELIVSNHTKYPLPDNVISFLSQPMGFSKFVARKQNEER